MATFSSIRQGAGQRLRAGLWDAAAVLLVLGIIVSLALGSRAVMEPLPPAGTAPLALDPATLPELALFTTLRMAAAMVLSLLFTFTYATLAAKNRSAERLLIPILDIVQSVPILGFISVTVVFFMSLAPGLTLGAEFAAIFAIFTSQAWNMAFSFYQSLRTVPEELTEAARSFRLGGWMRFWKLEVPFAMPSLVWNMMMSMSGGWFFVVASEVISVGETEVMLPGLGSWIAVAIAARDLGAIFWAILAMLATILIYDQLFFRPLVAWADRFRFEQEAGVAPPRSWVLTMLRRSGLVGLCRRAFAVAWRTAGAAMPAARAGRGPRRRYPIGAGWLWQGMAAALILFALWETARFIAVGVTWAEVGTAFLLGLATMVRVFVLIALASVIWVPAGVWLGLRPGAARIAQPVAQFMAAFPANLLFPLAVSAIIVLRLDPDIWLSPLMILGTQWYILFNVIAGASGIPGELRDIATSLRVRGWHWWRRVALPAIFPAYMVGAITASGGSWNASIVAEIASWGDTTLRAHGLGAYITEMTEAGDFPRIVLGIAVMSAFVVVINRALWRPLQALAERKFRLG